MDTLTMHRTLLQAGFKEEQADAIIRVVEGGVATRHDLELLEIRVDQLGSQLRSEIEKTKLELGGGIGKVDQKVTLAIWGIGVAIVAPLITRLILS
jgi:hypothetical protein